MKKINKIICTLLFTSLFVSYISANSIMIGDNTISSDTYENGEIIIENNENLISFSINPNEGYYYDNVVVSYQDGTILTDNNEEVYSFDYDISYGNVNVTCDFHEKKVITFDANGGESELESLLFVPGSNVTLPNAHKSAYAFEGWTTVRDDVNTLVTDYTFDDSIILYAYYVDDFVIKNLKVTSTGVSSILVTFDETETAEYYEIFRSTKSNKGFKKIATISTFSYTNKKLTFDTTYYYKIRAYKVVDGVKKYSPYSKVVGTKTKVNAPNFSVKFNTYNSAKIVISKVSSANGYQIYRSESENGTYKLLTTTTKTSYVDKNLKVGKTYYYKVRAYKLKSKSKKYGSYSLLSYEVTPVTPNVSYFNNTDSSFVINASGSTGVDGYLFYELDEFNAETLVSSSNSYSNHGEMNQIFKYNIYSYKNVDDKQVLSAPAYIEAQIKPQTPVIDLISDDFFDLDEIRVRFGNLNLNDEVKLDFYKSIDGKTFTLDDSVTYNYKKVDNPINVYVFGRENCPYTKALLEELNSNNTYTGMYYNFTYFDLANSYNNQVYTYLAKHLGISYSDYEDTPSPLLIIGDTYYIGYQSDYNEGIESTIINQYTYNSGYNLIDEYNSDCYSWERINTSSLVTLNYDEALSSFNIVKNNNGYFRYIYNNLTLKNTNYYKVVATINDITTLESNVISNKAYVTPVISTMLNLSYGKMLYMFNVPSIINSDSVYYELYRSTSKSGKYTKFKTISAENYLGELSVPFNKTYYYKVRYYQVVNGKKIYSSFSKVYKFKNAMTALDKFPVTLLSDTGYLKIKSVSFSKYKTAGNYIYYKVKFNIKESYGTKKTNTYFWLDFYNLLDLDYADYYGRIQFSVPKGTKKNWSKTVVLRVPKSSIYYLFE